MDIPHCLDVCDGLGKHLFARSQNPVIINNGNFTAEKYILKTVDLQILPFAPYMGQGFLLMHVSTRPHVARVLRNCLEEAEINNMTWPEART